MGITWSKETDVVVVGYGLAGAVAASEAHDAGARVIILEKSRWPGGCSILSGGGIRCARDIKAATDYLTETQGGRVDVELIEVFARGLVETEQHVRKMARVSNATVRVNDPSDSYAAARQADGKYRPETFPVPGGAPYPFPGHETFYNVRVAEVPGFTGFPWVRGLNPAGTNLWKVAMDNVETRGIPVMLATPARRLLRDADGRITGVLAESPEGETAVKARRGVILACGGFEQNQRMLAQYAEGQPMYSMAPLTHTGDGVVMAQEVGAALWHMWHIHGSYGFKFPGFPIAFRHCVDGTRNPKRRMPWIVVDKYGSRYMNEYPPAVQDIAHRAMQFFDPDMPGYPRIPSFMIFDEAARKRGPIARPEAIGENFYEWSDDNMREVGRGWVLSAPGIRELALRVREMPASEGRMEPETLEATVSAWNEIVRSGKDPLHRPEGTMLPVETPPFYAVPVWPVISNTQGGPQHDVRQQILDAFGTPVPRLYSAGELGSFFAHIYLQAGNLAECLIAGRIAGRNAAAEPAD